MTRLQRLTDAISAIEKNLDNLKETLEELKSKSFTGICESNINEQDLEEVIRKLGNKPITNNEERDSVRLQRILDELTEFIDSHKKHGPKMEFDYYIYGLIWQSLKELLKDKTYGLKAILLLWNWVGNNRKHYLLSTRFPWKKDDTDNVNNISDWLLRNYFTNMMFVFLDSAITINPSKE